ncbi:MAG: hypothetical protein JNL03_16465 [Prolixibacteraceae bacterium]|nr:hypothetical protein [Prolixibacteraceae bacterium]
MINHSIYGGLVQLSGNKIEIEVVNDDVKGESPRALLKATSSTKEMPDGSLVESIPGGPFIDPKVWSIQPDGSGKAIFDFSEYFDAPVDYGFTFPAGNEIAVKHPLRSFDLNILAGCSYIENDIASAEFGDKKELWQAPGNAVAIRILKGGMSQDRQASYNESGLNFYQDYIQGNKFLTHRPNFQRISYNQPVRLWYLLPGTIQVVRSLIVEYTAADNSVTALTFPVTLDPDGLYEFILDPSMLGVPADAKQFKVYQSDGVTQVGESRTFVIDHQYFENNTFLFFANSLSGIDDVWFTGAVKLSLNSEGETGLQTLDRTATTRDRSVVVTKKTASRKWSIFPGNRLNASDIEAIQDLIYSKFIWLVWNGRIVPVNLESSEFELTDTMSDLFINDQLELVFTEAHKNNHY